MSVDVQRLLLASGPVDWEVGVLHLTEHDSGVTVKEGNTGETLTVGELVNNHRLLWDEDDLSLVVGLELDATVGLLTTGVLTETPADLDETTGGTATTDVTDWRVTSLDGAGNVENGDLGGEVLGGLEGIVLLVDHDVTDTRHVILVEGLDVHANVVTGLTSLFETLVVHLDGEDLARASGGGGVGREEENILTRKDVTLLDAASEHITDTLDLVDTRDRETHLLVRVASGRLDELVEALEEGGDDHGLLLVDLDLLALPPWHVVGLGEEVVAVPSGDRNDRNLLLDEASWPADDLEGTLHLVLDLLEALLVVGGVVTDGGIHLVDSNHDLLDSEELDEAGVLAGLALDLTGLVVTLLDGGGEVTVSRDHEHTDIGLGGTGNHVLDEVTVTRGVNDGVVVVIGEELLGGTLDGHTTLTLVLLGVHVESEGERTLTETLGLFLELGHGTLLDTSELEKETASGGRLTRVDVTANNDRHMLLLSHVECFEFD